MKNKTIILAGGSGFIGSYMCRYFANDNKLIVLTRNRSHNSNNRYDSAAFTHPNIRYVEWDARNTGPWVQELEGADMLINLTGKSVNCRYNYRNMIEIFDSRLHATRVLATAVNSCTQPPELWINLASATIYRNATDRPQDEMEGEISSLKAMNMPATTVEDFKAAIYKWIGWLIPPLFVRKASRPQLDFSVRVCQAWEKCFYDQVTPHTRKVCLRTAITLGNGGVMVPYLNLVKFGLGGRQGNGKQMYSWIHVEDICRLVEWLAQNQAEGTFNGAAPGPVTNARFMAAVRKATGHHFGLPAYKWMLEIGAKLIGTEPELILKSRWVMPTRLLHEGFVFKYPDVDAALQDIVCETRGKSQHSREPDKRELIIFNNRKAIYNGKAGKENIGTGRI